MAIVVDGYEAVFTLKDNGGNTANKRYVLRAATATEAQAAAAAILAELLDVTDAAIWAYRVSEIWINDTPVLPGEGVQIENQASIVGLIDGEVSKYANLYVPAPEQDIFVGTSGPNADIIDTADADLLAYLALFESTGSAYISDGEDWGQVVSGKRIHRKSSKG